MPLEAPEPEVWIPVSEKRPWHCQIHYDPINFTTPGGEYVDERLLVFVQWFGMVEAEEHNRVYFLDDIPDLMGMPQPTFEYQAGEAAARRAHQMIGDMASASLAIGGWLPGQLPEFEPPGASLHFASTTRMGETDDGDSVVDPHSRHWGFDNLYVGGCGVIPEMSACNPTLTAAAIAVRSARALAGTRPAAAGAAGAATPMPDDAPGVRIAASPINWHNDDFPILGSLTSVDAILAGMQAAGMAGTELGSLFPTTRADLEPILEQYGLELAGGWFSAYLLTRDMADERERFVAFVEFLESMGTKILHHRRVLVLPLQAVPAERVRAALRGAGGPALPVPAARADGGPVVGPRAGPAGAVGHRGTARDRGRLPPAHADRRADARSSSRRWPTPPPTSSFTIDTGHLRFAGADAVEVLETYIDRTVHLHVKDVRDHIADVARAGSCRSIRGGRGRVHRSR